MKKIIYLLSILTLLVQGKSFAQHRTLFGTNTLYESIFINPSQNHFNDSNTFIGFSFIPMLNLGIDAEYRGFAGKAVGSAIFGDDKLDLTSIYGNLGKSNHLLANINFEPLMLRFKVNKKYKGEVSIFGAFREKSNISITNDLMGFLLGGNAQYSGKRLNGFFDMNVRSFAYGEAGLGYRMNITPKLGVGVNASYLKVIYYKEALIQNSFVYFAPKNDGAFIDLSANGVYYSAGVDIDTNGNIINTENVSNLGKNYGLGFALGADYQVTPKLKTYFSARDLGFLNLNADKQYVTLGKTIRIQGANIDTAKNSEFLKNLKELALDTVKEFDFGRAIDPSFNFGATYNLLKFLDVRGNVEIKGLTFETAFTGAVDLRIKSFHLINILGFSTNGYRQLGTSLLFRTKHTDFYIGLDQYGSVTNKFFSPGINANIGLAFRIGKKTDNEKRIINEEKLKRKTKDRDLDGVTDAIDQCPDIKGPAYNNGCPDYDKDKDGILDSADRCPEEFGPMANFGCPDKDIDNDGIIDRLDECPDQAGDSTLNGCPNLDKDNDGVLDSIDLCPDKFGPIGNKGCPYPDTDGDGIFDQLDKCPEVPGISANDGCPELKKAELEKKDQDIIDKAFSSLKFKSGSAIIDPTSYPSLNKIIVVFVKYPKLKLILEGHTDNSGDPVKNLKLSQDRADAVKKFLVSKGLEESKITSLGYGSSKPIDPSNTPEARALNRRVEFIVVE